MKPRRLKVEPLHLGFGVEPMAMLRLKGRWLKEAGFAPGQRVTLSFPAPGRIELQVDAPAETPAQREERLAIEQRIDQALEHSAPYVIND